MMEAAAQGVRLLTVHTAKGLEFPIVILADLTANLAARDADRYIDPARGLAATRILRCAPWELLDHEDQEREREKAEGVRVAYVAATRARDLLVIPAVGDQEMEGWLQPLNKAIYPELGAYRQSRPVPGLPAFGDATVLFRPMSGPEESVRPGLVQPKLGAHEVVWWDPAKLRLSIEAKLGLRSHDTLAGDSQESGRLYREWLDRRARSIASASSPEWEILNPSEATDAPGEVRIEHFSAAPLGDRPSGRRFGTLVHMILRDAGFDGSRVAGLAAAHGRAVAATPEEVTAAGEAALAALGHPLFDRARRAAECYRELPVSWKFDGNRIMEGSIDMAFLEDGRWRIVDFKTDVYVEGRREQYERQLRWYAAALSQLTSCPAECYLLSL